MKKIIISISLLLLILSAGCGNQKEAETIKIGSILILTGEGAAWGNAARNGIDLAVEEINAAGGINGKPLEVVHEDDQSDAKKAISAFHKLTDLDGIDIIIGTTWSHTGIPLVQLADEKQILMISPSLGMKEFNEGSKYLFNTWPHDYYLSQNLADYVYEKGHRKVAVIGAEQIWVKDQTTAFTKRFEELGGSVEVLVEPLPTSKDVYSNALKIKAAKDIDAIVSTTDGVLVGTLVAKELKTLGVDLPIYSITIDADTLAAAQGAYEGMQFLTYLTPTEEFEKKYEERFGMPIDIGADSAYDAVMLIAQAMRETGSTDTNVLQTYLNSIESYEGASGNLTADGKGGFTKDCIAIEVRNGEMMKI